MYMPTPYNRVVALEAHTRQGDLGLQESRRRDQSRRRILARRRHRAGDGAVCGRRANRRPRCAHRRPGSDVWRPTAWWTSARGSPTAFAEGNISLSSPPKVYKNLVITGARVQESPALGYAGDTRAWDLRTGKLVWQFHHIPHPGEVGHDTWEGDGWKNRSGANTWGFISVDPALGLVYLPIGSPSYDFYGGDRKGANLFGNSIVALEAETGKYRWHLPDGPARHVGLRLRRRARADRRHAERPAHSRARRRRPSRAHLHPRSPHGQADLRHQDVKVPQSDVPGEDNRW